jgi:hypothetical protein
MNESAHSQISVGLYYAGYVYPKPRKIRKNGELTKNAFYVELTYVSYGEWFLG